MTNPASDLPAGRPASRSRVAVALHVAFAVLAACGGGPQRGAQPAPAAQPASQPAAAHGHPHGDHFHHRFEDAEHWARVFDDPERDAWQKPDEVIAALALDPSARVADLGAGTGYFAMRLARAVPQGVVYAVDVEPDMVRYLGERARREGLQNVVPVLATPAEARIPEPVDLVLVVDTYHHIAERAAYFARLSSSLRPGGRLAIIDFTRDSPIGPPAQHRIAPETVSAELAQAGFVLQTTHELLPHQYFLVYAQRQEAPR